LLVLLGRNVDATNISLQEQAASLGAPDAGGARARAGTAR